MKKLVLTSVCAALVSGAAFAQGNVNWGSISPVGFTAETNSTVYSSVVGVGNGASTGGGSVGVTTTASAGAFYYELLYTAGGSQAATPTTLAALETTWGDTGLKAQNSVSSAGKAIPSVANSGAQVPWSTGTTDSIVLVGWSANLGTTWAAAEATLNSPTLLAAVQAVGPAFFGVSSTGYTSTASTSTSPGATVIGNAATIYGSPIDSLLTPLYEVSPVPEPTTLALGAMGALSLLALRRKKA
jgi:hypothetical protein